MEKVMMERKNTISWVGTFSMYFTQRLIIENDKVETKMYPIPFLNIERITEKNEDVSKFLPIFVKCTNRDR